MLEHKRSYSYCERTYYSNTQKQRTTASSFSSRHPEDGVEGGEEEKPRQFIEMMTTTASGMDP